MDRNAIIPFSLCSQKTKQKNNTRTSTVLKENLCPNEKGKTQFNNCQEHINRWWQNPNNKAMLASHTKKKINQRPKKLVKGYLRQLPL